MKPTFEDIPSIVRQVLCAGWREARKAVIDQNQFAASSFLYSPGAHIGDPALPADALVNRVLDYEFKSRLPGISVVGEEHISSLCLRNGEFIAVVDPVDGTTPLTHLGCAWAVVVLVMQWRGNDAGWLLPVVGLVTSSGVLVSLWHEETVHVGLVDEEGERIVADCTPSTSTSLSAAVVGAKPKDRKEGLIPLHAEMEDAVLFNVGGNPVVHGVIGGNLGAIIALKKQTAWDAAYALLVAKANGTVGDLNGTVHDAATVLSWYRRVELAPERAKIIPPLIAAKDPATYTKIVDALRRANLSGDV